MKKLFTLLAAVLVLAGIYCINCKAEDMINFVPADAEGVVFMDAARLLKLSHLQDLRQDNAEFNDGWKEFEAQLKSYGLTQDDLPSQVMMFFKSDADTQNAGILALTKITEKKLLEILKINKDKIDCTHKTFGGRKAYVIGQKGKEEDKAVVTYLKSNLVLICDDDRAEDFCKNVGKTKNEKLMAADKKADKKALMYVLFANEKAAKPKADSNTPQQNPMNVNPLENIDSAMIALDLTGKDQKDLSLKADLKCTDAQNAAQMAMQLKTFVMIMGMQMGQDPELGKAVTEAIKIDQKDKDIKVDISISEEILGKLKELSKQKQQNAIAQGNAAGAKAPAKAPAPAK
ncbi:MAG: hypothetical protein WCS27_02945 [Victivallaceae bacterium]